MNCANGAISLDGKFGTPGLAGQTREKPNLNFVQRLFHRQPFSICLVDSTYNSSTACNQPCSNSVTLHPNYASCVMGQCEDRCRDPKQLNPSPHRLVESKTAKLFGLWTVPVPVGSSLLIPGLL
ncbi:putative glycosidase crf1 [Fusarium oxysporum f. sp. albedinis]|nr:putative glycosidase crf1 [Fusarium oxysporum f. sp. albedinis]